MLTGNSGHRYKVRHTKTLFMHFLKQDLECDHYEWIEEKKDLFTGEPSRRAFDRFNGNQVLFLINLYGETSQQFTVEEGKTIEQKIQQELPVDAKSEIAVFNWIKKMTSYKS